MSEQRTEPCGCLVMVEPGHVYTKMCERHRHEAFCTREHARNQPIQPTDNRDLIGG